MVIDMNKKMKIVNEDSVYCYLTWQFNTDCNEYQLYGFNSDLSIYEKILSTTKNKTKVKNTILRKYSKLKVDYILNDSNVNKQILIEESDPLELSEINDIKHIDIRAIKSYKNITICFTMDGVYDKYYLYEKVNDKYKLLIILEDFIFNSDILKENHTYYVEAYNIDKDRQILMGKSDDYVLTLEEVKMNKPSKVSIIIPVYNCEKYLSRCVDSIILSSLNSLDIIMIDDGSTDNSVAITDWYKEKYSDFITVKHQENRGVSYTRNEGMKYVTGEFTGFVDNDDVVHPLMYENLYNGAVLTNADIAIAKTLIRNGIDDHYICLDVPNNKDKFRIYNYEDVIYHRVNNDRENIYFVAIWNKIIKTSVIKGHSYPESNYYEDTAFTRMIYSYASKFVFCFDAYYVWDKRRQLTTGTATTYNYRKKKDDPYFYHKAFKDAVFYGFYTGNPLRMDYIVYDIVYEVYEYLTKIEQDKTNEYIKKLYTDELAKINGKYNIKDDNLFRTNRNLNDFVNKMIS